jgi:quercetin dioxygenase-like cupin family protein
MRARLEVLGYRVTRYVYPAGTRFPPHDHDVDKIDGVLSGRFRMTLGDESLVLGAGDMLEIPAHARHSAEVVGDESVVSLDAVRVA